MLKNIFLLNLVISALICYSAHAKETYKVAAVTIFPPFAYSDPTSGKQIGFDIDLINAIAEDQGFKIELTSAGFPQLFTQVQSHEIDIAISCITITPEREKIIFFSTPYFDAGVGIIKRAADTSINSIADLEDKTAGAYKGTTSEIKANELHEYGIIGKVEPYPSIELLAKDLSEGTVDIAVNDIVTFAPYFKKMPGIFTEFDERVNTEKYGIVVAKESIKLLNIINDGLKNIVKSGKYKELYDKYFK